MPAKTNLGPKLTLTLICVGVHGAEGWREYIGQQASMKLLGNCLQVSHWLTPDASFGEVIFAAGHWTWASSRQISPQQAAGYNSAPGLVPGLAPESQS